MDSFLALSVIESAPALTAPAAAETPLETPLTTFLIALFRRPSFLFLGASEDPEDEPPPEDDEEVEDPLDEEELEEGVDVDEEEPEEEPPDPCLPLSYPLLAAPLTALAALCAVPTALAASPTPPFIAEPTFLTALLTLESADAFFSDEEDFAAADFIAAPVASLSFA